MLSFINRFFLAALFFTLAVNAEASLLQQSANIEVPKKEEPEGFKAYKIWAAIPAGGVVGFGLGHFIQERSDLATGIFVVTDVVLMGTWTMAHLIGCGPQGAPQTQVDACYDRRRNNVKNLELAMIVSRIAQAIDLSIYSVTYYKKFHVSAFLLPNEKGQQLTLAFEF